MNSSDYCRLTGNFRKSLLSGHPAIGGWLQIPSAISADIVSQNQFDWVAVDQEHGCIGKKDVAVMCQAIRGRGKLPFVRLSQAKPSEAVSALEAGAAGLILPNIKNPQQFEEIADYCNYPPRGKRGVGFCVGNDYGRSLEHQINGFSPILIPMIENALIMDELPKLLALDSVDAIFIGPYDLSASLGVQGKFENKLYKNAIEFVLRLAKESAVPAGIHVVMPSPEEVKLRLSQGFQVIAYSLDSVMLNVSAQLKELRSS